MLSSLHHVYNRITGKSELKSIDSGTENSGDELSNSTGINYNEYVCDNKGERLKIVKEDVQLPQCFKGKMAFVLHNVFSKKECKDLIKKSEKMGYTDALVTYFGRKQLMKDVRNNKICTWDSHKISNRIWQRIEPYIGIPETWALKRILGLNEKLRFLKYEPGQYFAPHIDGFVRRDNGEQSYVTIQLYLNEGFKGGSTTFLSYDEDERCEVVPKTGSVLVFQHDILHEGSKLKSGRKYAVRTEVMYEKADPQLRVNRSKKESNSKHHVGLHTSDYIYSEKTSGVVIKSNDHIELLWFILNHNITHSLLTTPSGV